LPSDGSTITVGGRQFSINYTTGGDGNDVSLRAVGAGAPTLSSTVLNGGSDYINNPSYSIQHSMVESVAYTFSGSVSLSASDFTISGFDVGTTVMPTLNVASSAGGTVWTVTFANGAGVTAGSINDGEYNLHLGGSYNTNFSFYRLLGDFDGTHDVSIGDFLTFNSTFNRATSDGLYIGAADFDSSGKTMPNTVDIADFLTFNSNFSPPCRRRSRIIEIRSTDRHLPSRIRGRLLSPPWIGEDQCRSVFLILRLPDVQFAPQPLGGVAVPGKLTVDCQRSRH